MTQISEREALMRCVSYLAALNGSEWIKGDEPGPVDMRQRAKALQSLGFRALNPERRDTMNASEHAPNVYADALLAQGACNLGALVHGFDRVITQLQKEAREHGRGTDWINTHPAVVLFVEQLYHLSGSSLKYREAFAECTAKSNR